jgi:hypothetical protein
VECPKRLKPFPEAQRQKHVAVTCLKSRQMHA